MYYVEVKTKYNTIKLAVEDPNDPQLLEVLEQPYVIETRIEERQETLERLKKERDAALWHCVGTAYYNQVAQEKTEQIKKLTK
jgi:hypothetical protein